VEVTLVEYFVGYLAALISFSVVWHYFNKHSARYKRSSPIFSQSRRHFVKIGFAPMPDFSIHGPDYVSQSTKHLRARETVIVIHEDQAYWIQDNTFYCAPVVKNLVDHENKKIVDTISMDNVQLKKISVIVDRLTEEGSNDSGNTGNTKFF
jgi:hypothetical protein